jgi:predicted transposase YbfD/YdcC
MEHSHEITLMDYLADLPDPRRARGRRYEWLVILTILCVALVCGQKTVWAMAHWAFLHASQIIAALGLSGRRLPSVSTFYRALRKVSIAALECRVAAYGQAVNAQDPVNGCIRGLQDEILRGQAMDGKTLRGASAAGELVHLLSLAQHGSGVVLRQERVPATTNEITVVPQLLAGRDLTGIVITKDALLSQRTIDQQILDQGGDYLTVVKKNQGDLWMALDLLFQAPPLPGQTAWPTYSYVGKGHGRLERRTLTSSTELNDYVKWPGVQQALRRTCRRVHLKTGEVEEETTYGLTSLSSERVSLQHVEFFWRGHWTIENRDHYVRDVTLGEDQCRMHTESAAQALAALRNGVLMALRHQGWENIAAALRHYGASIQKALALIGAGAT